MPSHRSRAEGPRGTWTEQRNGTAGFGRGFGGDGRGVGPSIGSPILMADHPSNKRAKERVWQGLIQGDIDVQPAGPALRQRAAPCGGIGRRCRLRSLSVRSRHGKREGPGKNITVSIKGRRLISGSVQRPRVRRGRGIVEAGVVRYRRRVTSSRAGATLPSSAIDFHQRHQLALHGLAP